MVNDSIPSKLMLSGEEQNRIKSHDDFLDKAHKADYLNLQTKFTEDLTNLASTLKETITNADQNLQAK